MIEVEEDGQFCETQTLWSEILFSIFRSTNFIHHTLWLQAFDVITTDILTNCVSINPYSTFFQLFLLFTFPNCNTIGYNNIQEEVIVQKLPPMGVSSNVDQHISGFTKGEDIVPVIPNCCNGESVQQLELAGNSF